MAAPKAAPPRFLLIVVFLLLPTTVFTQHTFAAPVDIETLVRSARERNLAQDRYWHILLHYKPSLFGVKSLVDDPAFFASPKGKTDPEAELEATLRAFMDETTTGEAHPVCRFIARFEWLTQKLEVEKSAFPVSACGPFDKVIADIDPRTATLVFPTQYLNSPASMFGHTLLNIETETRSKMLAHAINYAARADDTNGILFAVKGLFGFYKGMYSVLPYYEKIQEYSDITQRDVWEYPLNLTRTEIIRMLRHLWELREVYANYYFFDENCAYNLLFLIEAGRPSLQLTEEFRVWALPIDTVRVLKEQGVIEEPAYRPSRTTQIRYKAEQLPPEHQEIALAIIRGELSVQDVLGSDESESSDNPSTGNPHPATNGVVNLDAEARVRIADLITAYHQYRYARGRIAKADYQKRFLEILKIRSAMGKAAEVRYDIPPPPRPDGMRESSRLHAGFGVRSGDPFVEVGWRPVFGDLVDTDYVSDQGHQIEFLSPTLRYYPDENRLELHRLDVLNIFSISPRDRFFKPTSWKVATGLFRKPSGEDDDDRLLFGLSTGAGMAWYRQRLGLFYGMIEPEIEISGGLEDGYAFGGGFSAGLLSKPASNWKLHLRARQLFFGLGDEHQSTEISLTQQFSLPAKNHAIRINAAWERAFDDDIAEASIHWTFYF